jgi:hypothetical protein
MCDFENRFEIGFLSEALGESVEKVSDDDRFAGALAGSRDAGCFGAVDSPFDPFDLGAHDHA